MKAQKTLIIRRKKKKTKNNSKKTSKTLAGFKKVTTFATAIRK